MHRFDGSDFQTTSGNTTRLRRKNRMKPQPNKKKKIMYTCVMMRIHVHMIEVNEMISEVNYY